MDHSEIRAILHKYFHDLLAQRKAVLDRFGPFTAEKVQGLRSFQEWIAQAITDGTDEIIPGEDMHLRLKPVLESTNRDISPDSADYQALRSMYKHAASGYCSDLMDYNQGLLDFKFNKPLSTTHEGKKSEPKHTLESVIARFINEMSDTWERRTRQEREDCFQLLTELLGTEFNISELDVHKARYVKETLLKVPAHRNKNKATKGLPLLAQIDVPDVKKISTTSINKYLILYGSLMSWATRNGFAKVNPFTGMTLKNKTAKERAAFEDKHIKAILGELDKGTQGLADKDFKRWGTLIGLYTGARLNEIASLTPADVKQEDGIWYFDINENEDDKNVKTEAGKRRIPVHSFLLKQGFLDYLTKVKAMPKGTRLLHEMTFVEGHGWGRKLSRWFNDILLKDLELKSNALVFHSLRHTAVTNMRRAGVESPIVSAVVGHEAQGVTEAVYMHKYTLKQLRDAIETL